MAVVPYASGEARVSSEYGTRLLNGSYVGHNGVDLVGTDKNIATPISGTVVQSRIVTDTNNRTWEWGNYVCIAGDDGNYYYFCHLSSRDVQQGDKVTAGDIIGVEGNTGYSFGSHLHFEVREGSPTGRNLDPTQILGIENRQGATYDVEGNVLDGSNVTAQSETENKKITTIVDGTVQKVEDTGSQVRLSSATEAANERKDNLDMRHTNVDILIDGKNVTKDIRKYLLSVSYQDNEEDISDSLTITLQDKNNIWLSSWLKDIVSAAAFSKKMSCAITKVYNGKKEILDCGEFELVSVVASQPSSTITINATAISFATATKQTKKNKMWEDVTLQSIASDIASAAGVELLYDVDNTPEYERVEQFETSDMGFLSELCHNAGISLKCTDNQLILFTQAKYEKKTPITTVKNHDGRYSSAKLNYGKADTQYQKCVVVYEEPSTGKALKATVTDDSVSGTAQTLYIRARCEDEEEAKKRATANLRLKNKYGKTAEFTYPGDVNLQAGCTVMLEDFGGFDGYYIIKQAVHSVSASGGYTTKITVRERLTGI